jgi:N-acetyl-anhydromuramyl-L-alanine amidase AmpD
MVDVIKYGKFKSVGKQTKKNQIILTHTSRNINDYLQSLKFRFNGDFKRIPNYIITQEGKILQLLGNTEYSEYFKEPNVNRNSIIISLENLGWLQKEPLTDHYINWIGDIYKGRVFEKKWRDYFFWQPYTEKQIENTGFLCKELFVQMKINPQITGNNTKINGVEKYKGLVSRSNFDVDFTDVSPAFNFDELLKYIENDEFA